MKALLSAPLVMLLSLAACDSVAEPEPEPLWIPPTSTITGVNVRGAVERREGSNGTQIVYTDTARTRLYFDVWPEAVVVDSGRPGRIPSDVGADVVPGYTTNPTLPSKNWLSVDQPIRHRGIDIPANTNLMAAVAARASIDGSPLDLLMTDVSPYAVGYSRFQIERFEFGPGPHRFTFRWETAQGDVFSDTITVYVDLRR